MEEPQDLPEQPVSIFKKGWKWKSKTNLVISQFWYRVILTNIGKEGLDSVYLSRGQKAFCCL